MQNKALSSMVSSRRWQREQLRLQEQYPQQQTYVQRQAVTAQAAKMRLLPTTRYEVAGVVEAQLAAVEK